MGLVFLLVCMYMHALLVCKRSWRCRYLWGAMCGEQQVAFYSQFYQHKTHISSDSIISIFPPLSVVVVQLRGTQCRRHMKTTFLFFAHNHTCKNATLQLFRCYQLAPLLCCSATEIDLQAAPPVSPEGYGAFQYVLSRSLRLFCSLLLPLVPPPPPFRMGTESEVISGQLVIKLSEGSPWTKTLSAQMKIHISSLM